MNKIVIACILLCAVLLPCRAQTKAVDPGDGPGLNWDVAELNGTPYNSLPEAFRNVQADGDEVSLLIGVTLDGKTPIEVNHSTCLNLAGLPLVCASGTVFEVKDGKVLTLQGGTVSGSFNLSGAGNLFAGEDVTLTGLGITAGTPAKSIYRILVELPDNVADGLIQNISYGPTPVTRYAREGKLLCLWLPQSVVALTVTYRYMPQNGTPANYGTAALTVTQHAENVVSSKEVPNVPGVTKVAEVVGGGQFTDLSAAFDAVATTGGTIRLLVNTALSGIKELKSAVTLNLSGWGLTSSGVAGFTTTENGSLAIQNGRMDGTFSVTRAVKIDPTVLLSAAILLDGKQAYRTCLLLPLTTTAATFRYGSDTDQPLSIYDGSTPGAKVAYPWLPAHTTASFRLTITAPASLVGTKTKSDVVIQTNHDNRIDMQDGGDIEAILFLAGEIPGTNPGTRYGTFYAAFAAACQKDGSQLWLQRNVQLSDDHAVGAGMKTTLQLNGHTLTVGGALLDASEEGSCLFVTDAVGTGRLTGICKMKGHIYLGKEIAAGNLGTVQQADGTPLYRLLAQVEGGTEVTDGFITYRLGTGTVQSCFLKDKQACLWLPINMQPETLALTVGGKIYSASAVQVSATHSNTVIVKEPAVVAKITSGDRAQNFSSLLAALSAAREDDEVQLLQSATLATAVTIPDGSALILDLRGFTLSTSATAGFVTVGSGNLLICSSQSQGVIQGNFTVTDAVRIPGSVSLSGLVVREGKMVYRTRVKLPAGTTAAVFSYADVTNRSATVLTEESETVAYPWLPAHAADKLTASVTIGTGSPVQQIKYDVAIQANHDNVVDFTKGEVEVVLKRADGTETPYESFHTALTEAAQADGSQLVLQRNVQFAHSGHDTHAMAKGVKTELRLNGFTLSAGNSVLDASALGSCLQISDDKGTGRITGTFRIRGNVYISSGIMAGNIGVVQDADKPLFLLYRVLVGVDTADGLMDYTFTPTVATPTACLVKNKIACIWLPGAAVGTLTLRRDSEVYTASDVRISATHSNTVTVARPGVVAKIGDTPYTSLKAAFGAVKANETISLATNATLEEPLTLPAGAAAVVFSLGGNTLTGKGAGAFLPAAGRTLHLQGGSVAGILDVTESVTIDRSVLLTAAVTSAGRQVYRTRLLLAADDKGKTLSYSYGTVSGKLPLLLEEGEAASKQLVAYCWLPARPATSFVLKEGETRRTRGEVAIQANHDNVVDLLKGDIEAILYNKDEDPNAPGAGRRFETFHDALDEAGKEGGSRLWLQRDVQFSGEKVHPHVIEENVVAELRLCGHNLTAATSCKLDALAANACLVVSDAGQGTGRITGTFRIEGNVYMGKDLVAGNIGVVQDGSSGTQLYRALVQIETSTPIPDGTFGTYSLGTGVRDRACYIRGKLACVWLPVSVAPETFTLVVNGNTYTAKGVQAIASHSNTLTVRDPAVVAMIGETNYTSLTEAFEQATDGATITLKQSTALSAPVSIGHTLKLELGEQTLTFQDKGAFVATASGSLLVTSQSERGILSGNPAFTGDICVSGSVSMSGLVSLTTGGTTATVYRCRLYLPEGAASGTYSYGEQSGALRLTGEKNTMNQPVSYAWLRSETGTRDLSVSLDAPVSGTRTLTDVLVQATHNNQFDMEAGDNVALVGTQYYPSLKTAIDAVNAAGGGTLTLVMDQTLRGIQSVTSDIRFDLNGKKLSLTADAGFDVKEGNTLLITDDSGNADKGYLYGTMLINGAVYVDTKVRLSGTVVKKGVEVQRLLVDKLPLNDALSSIKYTYAASGDEQTALVLSGTACLWLAEVTCEDDLQFTAPDDGTYETTLLPPLTGHNKRQDAYRLVRVDESTTWADDANRDCNVVVAPDAVLTLATEGQLKTLHRLTLCNRSQVVCHERVLATGGIVYHRSFAVANRWESFSLPFAAQRVTAVFNGEPVPLNPNLSDGTGGHFWLKTLAGDGTFNYVTEDRIQSNVGYILAVPANLTTEGNPEQAIRFASAPNQFLERTALVGVPPETTGFLQLATGILCALPMTDPFYLLNAEGTEYVRQMASKEKPMDVPPFSSYLLADKETTDQLPTLRMGELPTGNEEVVQLSGLRIRTVNGGILAETDQECQLTVYTLSGRICVHRRIPAGSTRLALAAGIYIVNREKVCVTK